MAGGIDKRHQAQVDKAKRDLERLEQQSEKLINTTAVEDFSPDDPIEKWGRILGRGIGYIVAFGLLYHLVTTYL